MEEYPDTPEKIAAYFECRFADRLAFTERGRASLADCKTDPRILWDLSLIHISSKSPQVP